MRVSNMLHFAAFDNSWKVDREECQYWSASSMYLFYYIHSKSCESAGTNM